jgi:hypothetical protein
MSTTATTAGASGAGGRAGIVERLLQPYVVFPIVVILWLAFGAALAFDRGLLDGAWQWLRGLWLPLQAVVWVLLLPWALALWAWESDWPLALRLLLVAGLAVANLYAFSPRRASGPSAGRPGTPAPATDR